MGLFPKEQGIGGVSLEAPRRMAWTRERGTRSLIFWFAIIMGGWFVIGRIQDHFLLQRVYPALNADPEGLTIVGTLDARSDYEHNMFRIVQANQTSRVELTEFGWRTIFDDKNGPMFASSIGDVIHGVQNVDSVAGDKVLQPFLRAGIAKAMGRGDWANMVSAETPLTIVEQNLKSTTTEQTTLGAFLKKQNNVKGEAHTEGDPEASDSGGSGSGRQVDHGVAIPADSLTATFPIVLVGRNFTGGWLDEHPATMFDHETYTVHLDLSDEGRARFFQWSRLHENENLVFVLAHRVATAGRISQTMNVSEWTVGPMHDKEMATALVDFVNHHSK